MNEVRIVIGQSFWETPPRTYLVLRFIPYPSIQFVAYPSTYRVLRPLLTPPSTINANMPGTWEEDMKDVHLLYDYDVKQPDGSTEKWRYELWCSHEVCQRVSLGTRTVDCG